MNFSNFKKCNIAPNTRGNSMYVRLCKSQHTITLSPACAEAKLSFNIGFAIIFSFYTTIILYNYFLNPPSVLRIS